MADQIPRGDDLRSPMPPGETYTATAPGPLFTTPSREISNQRPTPPSKTRIGKKTMKDQDDSRASSVGNSSWEAANWSSQSTLNPSSNPSCGTIKPRPHSGIIQLPPDTSDDGIRQLYAEEVGKRRSVETERDNLHKEAEKMKAELVKTKEDLRHATNDANTARGKRAIMDKQNTGLDSQARDLAERNHVLENRQREMRQENLAGKKDFDMLKLLNATLSSEIFEHYEELARREVRIAELETDNKTMFEEVQRYEIRVEEMKKVNTAALQEIQQYHAWQRGLELDLWQAPTTITPQEFVRGIAIASTTSPATTDTTNGQSSTTGSLQYSHPADCIDNRNDSEVDRVSRRIDSTIERVSNLGSNKRSVDPGPIIDLTGTVLYQNLEAARRGVPPRGHPDRPDSLMPHPGGKSGPDNTLSVASELGEANWLDGGNRGIVDSPENYVDVVTQIFLATPYVETATQTLPLLGYMESAAQKVPATTYVERATQMLPATRHLQAATQTTFTIGGNGYKDGTPRPFSFWPKPQLQPLRPIVETEETGAQITPVAIVHPQSSTMDVIEYAAWTSVDKSTGTESNSAQQLEYSTIKIVSMIPGGSEPQPLGANGTIFSPVASTGTTVRAQLPSALRRIFAGENTTPIATPIPLSQRLHNIASHPFNLAPIPSPAPKLFEAVHQMNQNDSYFRLPQPPPASPPPPPPPERDMNWWPYVLTTTALLLLALFVEGCFSKKQMWLDANRLTRTAVVGWRDEKWSRSKWVRRAEFSVEEMVLGSGRGVGWC